MRQATHALDDLVDIHRLQSICDDMSAATDMGLAVLDPSGHVLVSSGWQDICTKFHRQNEVTLAACLESDLRVNEHLTHENDTPGHAAYKCANGLWDVALPLIVDGEHVGTAYTGQFFFDDDDVDVDVFRRRARELGFDEEPYLAALEKVPVVSHERVDQTIDLLAGFVSMIADIGLSVVRQEEAERRLRAGERELQEAQEMARLGRWQHDVGSGRLEWSETIFDLFEIDPREFSPSYEAFLDAIHPDDRARVDNAYRASLESRRPYDIVHRLLMRDGREKWVHERCHTEYDADGAPVRSVGIVQDITDAKEAEQALSEWHDLMQEVIQHDPTQIAVYDRDLRYVFVSDRYLDDRRITDRDVIGKHRSEVLSDDAKNWPVMLELAACGSVERSEKDSLTRSDGSTMHCRWEARPWHLADGSIGGTISYTVDLTSLKQAEHALRRSEHLYETFIDATDDMAFLKDDELRYVIVNAANAAYFGRAPGEIVGFTDADLMLPAAAKDCRRSDQAALEGGNVVISHEEAGGRIYETRKFPVALAEDRIGVGGYIRDVTEQRRAEQQLARLNADLEKRVAERTAQLDATNSELQSFVYSISHDLRAPLRALDGFSQILLEDYDETLDQAGRGHLARIRSAARHMADLMDGLLQLSRINREELHLQPVDLSMMASAVLEDLRTQDSTRRVEVSIAPHLTAIADPRLARIVLENLIGNAWKFTGHHESAHIDIGSESQDDDPVVFFVHDDGAGFEMRYADKLFGAFQRLHTPEEFEGTGIGLATVQRIVRRHGGRVWAKAAVEKGATFWFTFAAAGDA